MPHSFTRSVLTTTFSLCIAAISTATHASQIADSVADFSGIQGQGGWYYGYYNDPFNQSGFLPMATFSPLSLPDTWVVDFDAPAPQYWTLLNALGGHPNGRITTGGRNPVEQWAVRRWVSNTSGMINISGNIADLNPFGGNGIVGHIFLNGTEFYNTPIANGDSIGATYSIAANVVIGSAIDFAIDPKSSDDASDLTRFTVTISAVPEPSTALLLLFGVFIPLASRTTTLFSQRFGQRPTLGSDA